MRPTLFIAALVWPMLATAQAPSPPRLRIESGDSIRVMMPNGWSLEGLFIREAGDSVAVRRVVAGRLTDTTLAFAELSAVDARVRHHSVGSTLKGLGLGVLVGSLAGVATAASSIQGCKGDLCGMAIIAVPFGAAIGGCIGLIGGALHTSVDWQPVWRPDPTRP